MSNILGECVVAPARGTDPDVIFLAGELDLMTAPALRSQLMSVTRSTTAAVLVLDLSQVRFIDAQSAGIIAAAGEAARCHGTQLWVDGLHGMPKLVFDLLGLAPLLARRAETVDGGRNPGD